MCYASAEGHSRNARAEEVLVVRRQPHGTNWLVSPEEASIAVCLRTGTEVELLYIPEETQRRFGTQQEATARFKTDDWWRRDVFVLMTGHKLQLKKLQEGQVVRVLSVPAVGSRKEVSGEKEQTKPQSEMASLTSPRTIVTPLDAMRSGANRDVIEIRRSQHDRGHRTTV